MFKIPILNVIYAEQFLNVQKAFITAQTATNMMNVQIANNQK